MSISIHAPREGGDVYPRLGIHTQTVISIHAPREGGDGHGGLVGRQRKGFQSTPPARGATAAATSPRRAIRTFQSTPPARGATADIYSLAVYVEISIHAPREGGDLVFLEIFHSSTDFNPRPPRGGRLRLALTIHK